ncbi:MAG: holo-[acyl-carrier-protein] synthase [Desulfovibrionaceae bacterium]
MIVGLGLDVVELDRIAHSWARFGEAFAKRILAPGELERLPRHNPTPFLAARFAAKEAASKALGTGIGKDCGFHDVEVVSNAAGKPDLILRGAALRTAQTLGVTRFCISLTHGRDVAAAVVVLES